MNINAVAYFCTLSVVTLNSRWVSDVGGSSRDCNAAAFTAIIEYRGISRLMDWRFGDGSLQFAIAASLPQDAHELADARMLSARR